MNRFTPILKELQAKMVGAIVIDSKGGEVAQVTGPLGTDPRFPDKWLVSNNQAQCYVIFTAKQVHEIKADRIFLRMHKED